MRLPLQSEHKLNEMKDCLKYGLASSTPGLREFFMNEMIKDVTKHMMLDRDLYATVWVRL
jgi:hypothetical protein